MNYHDSRLSSAGTSSHPPGTAGRAVVLLTMCLGVLIAQVETSVVNLAVQPIGADFHADVAPLQWVINAYNFAYASALLTGGLIADLYGRRRAFLLGAAVMTVASLVSAFAPHIGVLIAGQTLAGLGAALLIPSSLAIIRVVWPEPDARARALGIWAGCNGLAFAIGPSLGGFLIDWFGWRSVFVLIAPLGLTALGLAAVGTPESADPKGRRVDALGQMLGALTLGSLAFAAIAARNNGAAATAALAVCFVALPLFLVVEHRAGEAALVPLDLFGKRAFSGAFVATASMTFGIYGMVFTLPLLWQSSGQLGPQGAGLALMPVALVFFIVSTRSGALTERFGIRLMTAGGTALIGCGLLIVAATNAGSPLWLAEAGLVMAGLGMGLNTGPLLSIAVDAVAPARSGTAAALINVARMTGATLGVALLGAIFAIYQDGSTGLRIAMLVGGAVQLCGAGVAWGTIRPRPST